MITLVPMQKSSSNSHEAFGAAFYILPLNSFID